MLTEPVSLWIMLYFTVLGTTMVLLFTESRFPRWQTILIAYTPCIAHGIRAGMSSVQEEMKKAVESGFWILVVAAYFLLSFLTHRWDITWLIFLVAPAVWGILHAAASHK